MHTKPKLTQALIDREGVLPCPTGRTHFEYPAGDRSGLYLDVRPNSEVKTFFLRWKNDAGKSISTKIGRSSEIKLKQAKQSVITLKGKIANGGDPQSEALAQKQVVTWTEFFEKQYLPYKRSHKKRTIKNDEEMHRLRIKEQFGEVRLNKITQRQIQQFHIDLRESGLSAATADLYLKFLRHAMNLGVDWGVLKSNPALKVKQFNQTRVIHRALDPEELSRLMKVLSTDKNRMACHFFMLALALGTRRGELLLAEWKHVDRKNKTLFIPGSNAKSARDRQVFLSDFALPVLDQLGTEGKHDHLFISSRTGKRLTAVSKAWEKIRVKAQIEDCRIHDLRRTHGTLLAEGNVNAMLIKDALGHASVTTTQIYVSPHDEARHKAANIAGHQLATALQASSNI